jgi:hypothetical protein
VIDGRNRSKVYLEEVKTVVQKKIRADEAEEILSYLSEIPNTVLLSVQEFVATYFDELEQSGQPLRTLHKFLTINGIDVGSYGYFKATYKRIERVRKEGRFIRRYLD